MTDKLILIISLLFMYYHIGGLATTNILRLTRGNNLSVSSSKCVCDNCGGDIPVLLQLPIISYIVCNGKCNKCGGKIPFFSLVLEIVVFVGMSTLSIIFSLSALGVFISFVFYEIVRLFVIILKGRRVNDFKKQYCKAVFSMFPFFICVMFVSILYQIV